MTKYFYILNWILLLAVITIGVFAAPVLHSQSVTVGAILAAMFTGGLTSWQYHRDLNTDKDRQWRNRFFNKDYVTEIIVQLVIAVLMGFIALITSRVMFFVTGFAFIMALNYIIEGLYAHYTHKFPHE